MNCDSKQFTDRIHRISGQISAIEKMYEEKRTAEEILQQVTAVRSSLASLAKVIVEAEVQGCLDSDENQRSVAKLVEALVKVT